jgi:CubicO group peptidase (beta-lactamase class C family)
VLRHRYFSAAFFLAFLTIAFPAMAAPDNTAALDRFLRSTVKTYSIPGLAVAVVNDKGIVFAKAYGDVRPGAPITSDTPFLLGSTSKTFTALAVLKLVRDGRIDLDAPVKRYLPEFALATSASDRITVRNLLNHTSGIVDTCIKGSPLGAANLKDEVATVRSCTPATAPGKKFVYCNTNYRILGRLVERVSGMPFGRFVEQQVFGPLGMRNSHAGPDGVQALAPGHTELFGMPIGHKQTFRPGALPSGYLVSSATDLARFLTEELNAAQGRGRVLDSTQVTMSWTPALPKPVNGALSIQGYGMGWMRVTRNGHTFMAHGGTLENYQSFISVDPDRDLGVVILVNQGSLMASETGFNAIREGVLDIIDGKAPPATGTNWPPLICLGIFLLVVAIEAFRTYRAARRRKAPGWGYRLSTVFDIGLALFLLFGFLPLMNFLTADNATWELVYAFVPELFYILAAVTFFAAIRGGMKIAVLRRARRGHHRRYG